MARLEAHLKLKQEAEGIEDKRLWNLKGCPKWRTSSIKTPPLTLTQTVPPAGVWVFKHLSLLGTFSLRPPQEGTKHSPQISDGSHLPPPWTKGVCTHYWKSRQGIFLFLVTYFIVTACISTDPFILCTVFFWPCSRILQCSPLGTQLGVACIALGHPHLYILWVLPFSSPHNTPGSACLFLNPALDATIALRSPGFIALLFIHLFI